jgi:hypothetical protein
MCDGALQQFRLAVFYLPAPARRIFGDERDTAEAADRSASVGDLCLAKRLNSFAFFILTATPLVLPNEFDSCGLECKQHGLNGCRRHDSLMSLKSDHG